MIGPSWTAGFSLPNPRFIRVHLRLHCIVPTRGRNDASGGTSDSTQRRKGRKGSRRNLEARVRAPFSALFWPCSVHLCVVCVFALRSRLQAGTASFRPGRSGGTTPFADACCVALKVDRPCPESCHRSPQIPSALAEPCHPFRKITNTPPDFSRRMDGSPSTLPDFCRCSPGHPRPCADTRPVAGDFPLVISEAAGQPRPQSFRPARSVSRAERSQSIPDRQF